METQKFIGDIHYQSAEAADLPEAIHLYIAGVQNLLARNGLPPAPLTVDNRTPGYRHILETGIFEVAKSGDKIVGLANAIVRDRLWFLSGFWVAPEFQVKGVGRPLLRRVYELGKSAGAETFATWSSIDFAALACYLKLGLMPVTQIFSFAGVPHLSSSVFGHTVEPLSPGTAEGLDQFVRGTSREQDHQFWQRSPRAGFQIRKDKNVVGYFYVQNDTIGPVAWMNPEDGAAVTQLALEKGQELVQKTGYDLSENLGKKLDYSGQVRIFIPGVNHMAIKIATQAGLKIVGNAHLLSSKDFGRMGQYLPSGPILF